MEVTVPHMLPFALFPKNNDQDNEIESSEGELRIHQLDTCVEENGANHHTDKFELMGTPRANGKPSQLVVRRGQEFLLKLICNRPINTDVDTLWLELAVDRIAGEWISHGHGTVQYVLLQTDATVSDEDEEYDWTATLQAVNETEHGRTELAVLIKTSPFASVSQWNLTVKVISRGFEEAHYKLDQPFFLLFNPWCTKDPVYLDDEAQRREYVLEDITMIWKGNERSFSPRKWKLGQYEENVLECSLWLLGAVARLPATFRGNQIKVCRALSGVVNSNDDYGVVAGNWSGNYRDGTAPSTWTGSVKILQEYYQQKDLGSRDPVRYGQCWVFAGVLGTLCRALGIPCRIVTNFNSAHDTEGSLTIDEYLDEEGKPKRDFSRDSVWNFHVWNEVWMRRPDIGTDGYDGWQVIDGTPQEFSDGMYKLGPAPVAAVKNGRVHMQHDCHFVFSEVNADKVLWRFQGPGKLLELVSKNTTAIGKFISTKAVGLDEREDITLNYKCEEQSYEAKRSMMRALKLGQCDLTKHYLKILRANDPSSIANQGNDIEFELELNDQVFVGESFTIVLRIRNVSDDREHFVNGRVLLDHILYTGKNIKSITNLPFSVTVGPNGQEMVEVPIHFDDYYEPGMDEAIFKVSSFATIEGADNGLFAQKDYCLRKPAVQLVLAGEPILRASLKVTAAFYNPLPIPITDGTFQIECSGICKTVSIPEMMGWFTNGFRLDAVAPPLFTPDTLLSDFSAADPPQQSRQIVRQKVLNLDPIALR
uniref:protein-glutamine gamma-glutamyltransferase n=1 Tax=Anopheles atroparvus TaxID=41427 RepID=A0A182J8Q9_ANOAO